MHKMTEMEITYNIQTVYTYHEKDMPAGKTKVHIFSRKVSRNIWEYAPVSYTHLTLPTIA